MALDYINSGDESDHGTGASAENLDTTTMLVWILNHSAFDGVFNFICTKGIGGSGGQIFSMTATGGTANAAVIAQRRTTAIDCRAESTGDVGLDNTEEWLFIAATLAPLGSTAADNKLFTGNGTTLATEVGAYQAQRSGTGAEQSNAGEALLIGNRPAGDRFLEGRVGFVHWTNTILTLAEIRAQQYTPFPRADSVLFTLPGWDGTGTQADYSGNGNTGTVTGADLVDGPPISPIFGYDPEWAAERAAGLALVRFGNDTVNLSEGSQASRELLRFGPETVEINEATVRPRDMARFGPDVEQISEATLRTRSMNRFGDDVEEVGEASQPSLGLLRFGDDTVELNEAIDNVLGLVRFGNDTVEITETTQHSLGLLRFAADTVELTEGLVRFRALARLVADTCELVEGALRTRAMSRFGDDTEQVTEALLRFRAMARVVDETVEVTEVAAFVRGLIRAIAETEQITEVALFKLTVALAGLENFIDEVLRINEASIVARGLVRVLPADTEEVSEGTAFRRTFIRFGADTEDITEATAAVLGAKKQIAETEEVSEGTVVVLASPDRVGVLKIRDEDDIDWREVGPVFA